MEDKNRCQGFIKKLQSYGSSHPLKIAFPHRVFGLKQDTNVRLI